MWLYLLSILIIGSVKSLTITYPYRPLVTYEPARTQIVDKTLPSQAFLVYLDNSGVERIVAYNYAEPVYAIRRISYINSVTPAIKTLTASDNSDEVKAREAHFRAWSLHQYQILKHEIDLLKGEGKEPSIEMKLKFLPLEKIALTADFSTIAESPEVQRIRMEHLNIWKRIDQTITNEHEEDSNGHSENLNPLKATVEDSPISKPIVNGLSVQNPENIKINIMQILNGDKSVIEQLNVTNTSDELQNVEPEITFANKIDSETQRNDSLDTNKSNTNIKNQINSQEEEEMSTTSKIDEEQLQLSEEPMLDSENNLEGKIPLIEYQPNENLQSQLDTPKDETTNETNKTESKEYNVQNINDEISSTALQSEEMVSELPTPLNPTQLLANESVNITVSEPQPNITNIESETTTESLIFENTKEQIEEKNITDVINNIFAQEQPSQDVPSAEIVKTTETTLLLEEKPTINAKKEVHAQVEKLIAAAPKIYVPQQVVDTDEVIRHRNEHLRIVNEALKKAKLAHEQYHQSKVTTELPTTVEDVTNVENAEVIEEAHK